MHIWRWMMLSAISTILIACTHQQPKTTTANSEDQKQGASSSHEYREAIRQVIRQHLRAIRFCYDTELNFHKDLKGKLSLTWSIQKDGHVSDITTNEVKDGPIIPRDSETAKCMIEKLGSWEFPVPPDGKIVEVGPYPFFFDN